MKPIIIIGSGLAGYTLLRELRRLDRLTPVVILTRDEGGFYYKPLLADALTHKRSAEALRVASAAHMERQFQAEIITHTQVVAIDPANRRVLTTSRSLDYFKLVLAVGAQPVRPPLAGDAAMEVLTVNDMGGYELFRSAIRERQRVAILGAGLVGCEFANDLRNVGYNVDVVEPSLWPLSRLLPEAAARPLRTALAQRGVGWHFGARALRLDRVDDHYRLTLSNGSRLEVDAVMAAAVKSGADLLTSTLID
ncbi:MAG: FAD-dependent oxidoreductase [Candidatus Competibacteraceae bacterium]|nr:FAD-dependent oxidoreductase [Candidatus Competibacteraceae bacterium]